MGDVPRDNYLSTVCDEIILQVLYCLDYESVLNLSQTCRKLCCICSYDQQVWSRLCRDDFNIELASPHPFSSFHYLYKVLHQSREILKIYLSNSYQSFGNYGRYGVFPNWLWSWIVLNTNPPSLPEWIRTYHEPFLRFKLSEMPLGKVLRVWNLKSSDLPGNIVTRIEYGTTYYRWMDIQIIAMRVHGGTKGLEKFLMRRCFRSRGYVERTFERIRHGTFTVQSHARVTQLGEG